MGSDGDQVVSGRVPAVPLVFFVGFLWGLVGASFHSVAQGRPFDLLVSPFWSSFSHDPKRFTFYSWIIWASEFKLLEGEVSAGDLRTGRFPSSAI